MVFWRQGSFVDQACTVSLHICISSVRLAHHVFSVHWIECGNEDILNKYFTKRNANTVDIITTAITTPLNISIITITIPPKPLPTFYHHHSPLGPSTNSVRPSTGYRCSDCDSRDFTQYLWMFLSRWVNYIRILHIATLYIPPVFYILVSTLKWA